MTDQTTATCPNCSHPQHLPGTECETRIDHGPSRFHLCLCLARPGAANACPPQMTCQGGTLGYADIWYLQYGHSLISEDGEISPEVLTTGPVAVGFPSQADTASAGQAPATDRADDLPARLEAALTERFTELGNPYSRMAVKERGPDGWPAEHAVGPNRVAEVLRELMAEPLAVEVQQPETQPRRGDAFEAWLKAQRDRYDRTDQREESSEFWHEFDSALDLYRLHADTGTPLGEHVCESRVVGDCECLEPPVVEVQQPSLAVEDCTCIPFTRQGGVKRYCQPGDTVDMISGWEIGGDCPHHRDAVKAQQPKEARP